MKRILIVMMTLICFSIPSMAFAENQMVDENVIQPKTDGYYYWKADSKENLGTVSGDGIYLGSMTATRDGQIFSISVQKIFTWTIESGMQAGTDSLKTLFGESFSRALAVTITGQSEELKKGQRIEGYVYPEYTKWRVTQRKYYRIDGYDQLVANEDPIYSEVLEPKGTYHLQFR